MCNWFDDWKQEERVESKLTFMQVWQGARNVAILHPCRTENNHSFECSKSYRANPSFFGRI